LDVAYTKIKWINFNSGRHQTIVDNLYSKGLSLKDVHNQGGINLYSAVFKCERLHFLVKKKIRIFRNYGGCARTRGGQFLTILCGHLSYRRSL